MTLSVYSRRVNQRYKSNDFDVKYSVAKRTLYSHKRTRAIYLILCDMLLLHSRKFSDLSCVVTEMEGLQVGLALVSRLFRLMVSQNHVYLPSYRDSSVKAFSVPISCTSYGHGLYSGSILTLIVFHSIAHFTGLRQLRWVHSPADELSEKEGIVRFASHRHSSSRKYPQTSTGDCGETRLLIFFPRAIAV